MNEKRWTTSKIAGIPCLGCGKLDSCTVSPDGNACKCWRDGGKIHFSEGTEGGPASGGSRSQRPRPSHARATKIKKSFGTPEAAAEAARRAVERDQDQCAAAGGWWPYHDPTGKTELFRVLRLDLADGNKTFRTIHLSKGAWTFGDPPGPLPLYRLSKLPPLGPIYVTEGEKAADAARTLGLPTTTSAHGCAAAGKTDLEPLRGRDVYVLPDNDDPGRKYARSLAAILTQLNPPARVRIVDLPGLPPGGDLVEFIECQSAASPDSIRIEVEALAAATSTMNLSDLIGGPVVRNLSEVPSEPIRWLWPGRIPLGKVTVIAGEGGVGKSFLTTDVAARVTRGKAWPDGAPGIIGSVVLANAEDDAGDTVRPRFEAAEGDPSQALLLEGIRRVADDGKVSERGFTLAHVADLSRAIERAPDCKLVIIDPVGAFLGGIDSYNEAEVRSLLAPLAKLAAERGVALVLVMHVNRRTGAPAMSRLMGSSGFGNAARAVWMVTKDKAVPGRRLLLPAKFNVGGDRNGLAFSIVAADGDGRDGPSVIVWDPEPVTTTADEAMAAEAANPDEVDERQHVKAWLFETLQHGALASNEVFKLAEQNGLPEKKVRGAARDLKVHMAPAGVRKPWMWSLPLPSAADLARLSNVGQPAEPGKSEKSGPILDFSETNRGTSASAVPHTSTALLQGADRV